MAIDTWNPLSQDINSQSYAYESRQNYLSFCQQTSRDWDALVEQ